MGSQFRSALAGNVSAAVGGGGLLMTGDVTAAAGGADLNWEPKLDQPIAQLEAQLQLEESQLAKNHTLSSIAYLHDTRLYLLFQDTLDYLPETAQRHEVALQNRWLDQRADAMTRAFLEDKDGEVARFAAGQAFIDETLKRIEELEQLRKLVVID